MDINNQNLSSEAQAAYGPALNLPVFSGPLDLLLHLIRKEQVSIYDIPIARICDQYHRYLRAMEELDLEIAGEFLWMASWLLQLKSRTLLPRSADEDGGADDPRHELVERLLEYRRVKELAAMLYDRHVVRRCLWNPSVQAPTGEDDAELEWEDIDLRFLATTYLQVMERFASAHPPPLHVLPLRFRVEDTMRMLYHRVQDESVVPLLRHLHSRPDTEEAVVLVVATLELVRLGGVLAEQRRPYAEIYLRLGDRNLDMDRVFERGPENG